jgi:hypothetical protein
LLRYYFAFHERIAMRYAVLNVITDDLEAETSSLTDAREYAYRIGGNDSLVYYFDGRHWCAWKV